MSNEQNEVTEKTMRGRMRLAVQIGVYYRLLPATTVYYHLLAATIIYHHLRPSTATPPSPSHGHTRPLTRSSAHSQTEYTDPARPPSTR